MEDAIADERTDRQDESNARTSAFFERLLWIGIPAAIAAGVAVIKDPHVDYQLIVYGILTLTAAFGLWTTTARKHRMEREQVNDTERRAVWAFMRKLEEELRTLRADKDEQLKMTCRLCIYDPHFDVDEKTEAFDVYTRKGWNHKSKEHMDKVYGEDAYDYLERWRKITKKGNENGE
jgi:hypothetical protein